MAWDNKKLNIRRDLGGSWLLKTILAEKPDTTTDDAVDIELTLNEVCFIIYKFFVEKLHFFILGYKTFAISSGADHKTRLLQ